MIAVLHRHHKKKRRLAGAVSIDPDFLRDDSSSDGRDARRDRAHDGRRDDGHSSHDDCGPNENGRANENGRTSDDDHRYRYESEQRRPAP